MFNHTSMVNVVVVLSAIFLTPAARQLSGIPGTVQIHQSAKDPNMFSVEKMFVNTATD